MALHRLLPLRRKNDRVIGIQGSRHVAAAKRRFRYG